MGRAWQLCPGTSDVDFFRDLDGVVATWCFIFVAVVRELSAAVILFTSDTKVLSVLIFDLMESGDLGASYRDNTQGWPFETVCQSACLSAGVDQLCTANRNGSN